MAEKYKNRDRVWENMDTLQEVWEFRGGRRRESGWMRIFVKEWTNEKRERERERKEEKIGEIEMHELVSSLPVYMYACVSDINS